MFAVNVNRNLVAYKASITIVVLIHCPSFPGGLDHLKPSWMILHCMKDFLNAPFVYSKTLISMSKYNIKVIILYKKGTLTPYSMYGAKFYEWLHSKKLASFTEPMKIIFVFRLWWEMDFCFASSTMVQLQIQHRATSVYQLCYPIIFGTSSVVHLFFDSSSWTISIIISVHDVYWELVNSFSAKCEKYL